MEIHLVFCAYRMRLLFKLWYVKSGSTNQQASFFTWKFVGQVGQFSAFSTFGKNAWLWEAVVSKPLNPQETKGYQWKDNVHIFHLIPSGTLYDHWSGHRDALKTGLILYKIFFLQKVDGFPYVEASMALPSLKGIFEYMRIRCINIDWFCSIVEHSGLNWFCSTCKYAFQRW